MPKSSVHHVRALLAVKHVLRALGAERAVELHAVVRAEQNEDRLPAAAAAALGEHVCDLGEEVGVRGHPVEANVADAAQCVAVKEVGALGVEQRLGRTLREDRTRARRLRLVGIFGELGRLNVRGATLVPHTHVVEIRGDKDEGALACAIGVEHRDHLLNECFKSGVGRRGWRKSVKPAQYHANRRREDFAQPPVCRRLARAQQPPNASATRAQQRGNFY
mmetsp:Transcript_6668/g.17380  ORF Transcript_6668/g.17380 Transcript_6668/m.17380 type:complete len:220 (-) Transcript_6668:221-880(-)